MKFVFSRASRALVAFAIAFTLGAPGLRAARLQAPQGSIVGTVVEPSNGVPIPNVEVGIVGTTLETHTDSSGHFVFDAVPVGRYTSL